jgi:hypothetical protein
VATQLPSATGSGHLPEGDFHPSDRACSQAHGLRLSPERRIEEGLSSLRHSGASRNPGGSKKKIDVRIIALR